jgi:hypothetical protein
MIHHASTPQPKKKAPTDRLRSIEMVYGRLIEGRVIQFSS